MKSCRRYSLMTLLGILLVSPASSSGQIPAPEPRFRPPGPARSLGIQGRNTDTGVIVVGTAPNSVAQSIGIERGDTVINVDAQQVGRIEGRVVELDDAVDRVLSRNRQVTLLLRNGRDGRLLNVILRRDQMGGGGPGGGGHSGMGGQIAQVKKWYLSFLVREARPPEIESWEVYLRQGKPLAQIQDLILASSEYYTLNGNDDVKFVGAMFKDVLRRQPVAPEGSNWLTRLKQYRGDRLKFAEAFRIAYQLPFP